MSGLLVLQCYSVASLTISISIAQQSAYVTEMSSFPLSAAHVSSGNKADLIGMLFGEVSGVGLGIWVYYILVVIVEGEGAVWG